MKAPILKWKYLISNVDHVSETQSVEYGGFFGFGVFYFGIFVEWTRMKKIISINQNTIFNLLLQYLNIKSESLETLNHWNILWFLGITPYDDMSLSNEW